ncbi:MAG: hypothetical protein E7048_03560 [Lentisphaerae bacterium]|nr:hypothetical protein [Lentisphaerota bacterium]
MNDSVKWYSPDSPSFRVSGFYFRQQEMPFRRFEENVSLPPRVDSLAWHTPGGQVAFMTDSSFIRLKYSLLQESRLGVNTRISSGGFDLYMGTPGGKQYFCGVTRMNLADSEFCVDLIKELPPGMKAFTIYFPLYGGVEHLEIGLEKQSTVKSPVPWQQENPVVFYGTSIIHGGCANRPGMALTNILTRRFNQPFLNFGFSGNGKGEPEVFEQLARIKEPQLYILDYGPNVDSEAMAATLPGGIDILRSKHRNTPILVTGKLHYVSEYVQTNSLTERVVDVKKMTGFQKAEVLRRRKKGDKNIHFVSGDWGRTPDWTEFTIDGVHPTDLGFYMHARYWEKCLKKYLNVQEF